MRPEAVQALARDGAVGIGSVGEFEGKLSAPRAIWMMLPAAIVDMTITDVAKVLEPGDILIDGGNLFDRDDITRAEMLSARGLHYVDVGTSGGVWGLDRGFCQMVGGEKDIVARLDPIFAALAPAIVPAPPTRRTVRTFLVARRCGLCRQASIGDARRVWRAYREADRQMRQTS